MVDRDGDVLQEIARVALLKETNSLPGVVCSRIGLYHLVGGSTGPGYSLLRFDLQEEE